MTLLHLKCKNSPLKIHKILNYLIPFQRFGQSPCTNKSIDTETHPIHCRLGSSPVSITLFQTVLWHPWKHHDKELARLNLQLSFQLLIRFLSKTSLSVCSTTTEHFNISLNSFSQILEQWSAVSPGSVFTFCFLVHIQIFTLISQISAVASFRVCHSHTVF